MMPMQKDIYPSIHPMQVSRSAAALKNALIRVDDSTSFEMGRASCRWHVVCERIEFGAKARLGVEINGVLMALVLDSTELLRAHAIFEREELASCPVDQLPQELAAAFAQSLVTPLLESLSQLLEVPVSFVGLAFAGNESVVADTALSITTTLDGRETTTWAALLPVDEDAAQQLAQMICSRVKTKTKGLVENTADVAVALSFVGGATMLDKEQYTALEVGDIVYLDEWYPREQTLKLVLTTATGVVHEAQASFAGKTATLTETFKRKEDEDMLQTDELEVRLTFELGSTVLTMRELSELQAGHVFELKDPTTSPVTVRANGRMVARGRLVDVNGTIGVQLTDDVNGQGGE